MGIEKTKNIRWRRIIKNEWKIENQSEVNLQISGTKNKQKDFPIKADPDSWIKEIEIVFKYLEGKEKRNCEFGQEMTTHL